MAVITKKIVTVCAHCECSIVEGQRVWFKGSDRYCHGKCLIASFETVTAKREREQAIAKQQRVDTMQQIIERRRKERVKL